MLPSHFYCQAQSFFVKRSCMLQSVFISGRNRKQERNISCSEAMASDMNKFALASKYKGLEKNVW